METETKTKRTEWTIQDRLCKSGPCGLDIMDGYTIVARIPDGATLGGGHCFPRQMRRAHLIAAAPDLLEVLAQCLAMNDRGGNSQADFDRWERKARAAIAKATPST